MVKPPRRVEFFGDRELRKNIEAEPALYFLPRRRVRLPRFGWRECHDKGGHQVSVRTREHNSFAEVEGIDSEFGAGEATKKIDFVRVHTQILAA